LTFRPYQQTKVLDYRLAGLPSGIGRARPIQVGRTVVRHIPLWLRLSFLLFVFTLPIESLNLTLNLGPVSIARLAGLLLLGLSIFYFKRCYSAIPTALWWFVIYLLIFCITGIFISPVYQSAFLTRVSTFVQTLAFFWIASNLLQDHRFCRRVLNTYALAAVLLTLAVRLGLPGFSVSVMGTDRASALGANPNYLGLVLAVAVVALLGSALQTRLRSLLFVIPIIPLLIMIVQTGSRAAVVALVAGSSCFLLGSGLSRKVIAAGLIGLALLTVGYLILTDDGMLFRWSETAGGYSAGRDIILPNTLAMIRERPLLGWGPVEFGYELRFRHSGRITDELQDAHNVPLNLLLETGIIGGVPFLIGMVLCSRAAWKARRGPLGITPFALLMALVAALQFHGWLASKPMWLVLAACLATRAAASRVPAWNSTVGSARSRTMALRAPSLIDVAHHQDLS